MVFLQPQKLNLTLRPAPLAPLADQSGQMKNFRIGFKVAKWRMFLHPKML